MVGSGLLQGRPEKDLAYVIGKQLTLMRPGALRALAARGADGGELRMVFLAALKLVQPNFQIKAEQQQAVAQYLERLRRSGAAADDRAAGGGRAAVPRHQGRGRHPQWSNAVDYTATRAGYLMCGDLEVAARLVQSEPVSVGVASPKEKIRDLVQWTVSDEYFALREHLGMQIGQG